MKKAVEDAHRLIVQEAILREVRKSMRRKPINPGNKHVIAVEYGMPFEAYFENMRDLRKFLGGKNSIWVGGYIIYAKEVPGNFQV